VLGGEWYVGVSDKMDSKDFKLSCHTGWLVDVVELGGFKYADYVTVKGVITGRTDSFRPPYGRATNEYPRRFVLVGTTNDDAYLRDTTGNRRFVPVNCAKGKIDTKWIAKNREQLFAEAYVAFLSGYEWWTEPPGINAVQAIRMTYDPWDAHIDAVLTDELRKPLVGKGKLMHFVPAVNILTMLGVPRAQQNTGHFSRLRELMRLREPAWEKHQYADAASPIAVSDGMGGITLVASCRGYRRMFEGTPPTANVIEMRNPQGASKF
jgi:predicted P-loop ATPase